MERSETSGMLCAGAWGRARHPRPSRRPCQERGDLAPALAGPEQVRGGRIPAVGSVAYHSGALTASATDPLGRRLIAREAHGDDPIFALDAEAARRREAGED